MRRICTILVLILAALAGNADAIEMFTNFHNGENIGLPPMQVPYSVYGGFGRGGWNPHAQGMPLKTYPPVPAMSPTGQLPGRMFDYYGASPVHNFGTIDTVYPSQLVSDRRHGRWQRGNSNSDTPEKNGDQANTSPSQSENAVNSPLSSGSSRKAGPADIAAPTQPKTITPVSPTILHAKSTDSEMFSNVPMIENSSLPPSRDNTNADAPANSEKNTQSLLNWPATDALFPHSDHATGDAG